ncbi:hypothetical protein B8V81_0912 [Paenibacillus pasadenensis]|uniref:Uncharacterized protein n=1 Tax=Paenibacillus pasadenensis TaxID=217090 RepID=A0A2N5N8N3_9BACL|nr:hypothetical protein B8V81_0912 [Paenibacillus pasadenensis]
MNPTQKDILPDVLSYSPCVPRSSTPRRRRFSLPLPVRQRHLHDDRVRLAALFARDATPKRQRSLYLIY